MKSFVITTLTFVLVFTVISSSAQNSGKVLLKLGDENITKEEFDYIYRKNNAHEDDLYSQKNLREYLDLYIKFKLKVKAALDAGIDTTEAFRKEYGKYRDQLAQPYLQNKEVMEHLINEAYERMKYEVEASHILIRVPPDAPPEDTLEAYRTISEIRQQIVEDKAKFSDMALEHSDDPSVKKNKGNLGFFTAFQMIYPFENAAYETPVGEVSRVFRTQFGYHILKVHDKRPSRGEIRVAHIMLKNNPQSGEEHQSRVKARIDSIYEALNGGAEFEEMVQKYSEDLRSKRKGGALPGFKSNSRFLPEEFKNEAFALKEDGDISRPFKTRFGWHIVKRLGWEGVPPLDEVKSTIKSKIKNDSRYKLVKSTTVERIKKENGFKKNPASIKDFYNLDSSILTGNWQLKDPESYDQWMFKIGKETYIQADFARYLEKNQRNTPTASLFYLIDKHYRSFVDQTVLGYEKRHLGEKHPEFRRLLKEYREGILLFEIMDRNVWSKAMEDSSGLEDFFQSRVDSYMYEKRVHTWIFNCRDKKASGKIRWKLFWGHKDPEKIVRKLNESDSQRIKLKKGKFETGEVNVLDQVEWKKQTEKLQFNDRYYVVKILEVIPPQPKPLDKVRGTVIADYQDYLEKKWLKSLREKYSVTVFEPVFKTLIK